MTEAAIGMIILFGRICGGEGCLLIRNRDRDCNKCPPAGPGNGKECISVPLVYRDALKVVKSAKVHGGRRSGASVSWICGGKDVY